MKREKGSENNDLVFLEVRSFAQRSGATGPPPLTRLRGTRTRVVQPPVTGLEEAKVRVVQLAPLHRVRRCKDPGGATRPSLILYYYTTSKGCAGASLFQFDNINRRWDATRKWLFCMKLP